MNITSYVSEVTAQFTNVPPSAYPALVWTYYIQYLWKYEPDSWVARIAYTARLFAILLSLPTVILGLLDISSYVIARTLGVVDDVKASTSDKMTLVQAPTIRIDPSGDSSTDSLGSSTVLVGTTDSSTDSLTGGGVPAGGGAAPLQPKEFFATEKNLKLSGVDILSPIATRASSPVLVRKNLKGEEAGLGGDALRRRLQQQQEMGSEI